MNLVLGHPKCLSTIAKSCRGEFKRPATRLIRKFEEAVERISRPSTL